MTAEDRDSDLKPLIYVASSWKAPHLDKVFAELRLNGFDTYDFRNYESAFAWNGIDPYFQQWNMEQFEKGLSDVRAVRAFNADMDALRSAEAVVLVNPCGASAHLELGWAMAMNIPTVIYGMPRQPELTYRGAQLLTEDLDEVIEFLTATLL